MDVDFNALREEMYYTLGRFIGKLNHAIEDGEVKIDVAYIQDDLDNLRSLVNATTCIGIPGDDDFRIIYKELERIPFPWFNEEE